MVSDTSAEDHLPSGSSPSAQPKAAARFRSYAEYLSKLDRLSLPFWDLNNLQEQLWLASFTEDGRCIKWHILRTSSKSKNLPAVDVNGIGPDIVALSSSDFQTLLQTQDENVAYRIVIATGRPLSRGYSSEVVDVLGLGLDLEPEIFDYVESFSEATQVVRERNLPLPWFRDFPALRIGNNALCILEVKLGIKTKTAIMFLQGSNVWTTTRHSHGYTMFSSKRPSQIREGSDQNPNYDFSASDTSLIRRFITEATDSNHQFGPGTFLYVCLAALIEFHLSTAPLNVPFIGTSGLQKKLDLKYVGIGALRREFAKYFNVDPGDAWTQLRMELDEQRHTLRWMTRFFQKHFDHRNQELQAAFEDIQERFKLRVQDLEQAESQLRDLLAAEGIKQSYHMAEMSIRESKRVMLLTALAFIFLPISLAASVYGMNVQQINGTGHSIGAFVITAFAMCITAVVLWAAIATLQSRKARLKEEVKLDPYAPQRWKWHSHLIMSPLNTLAAMFKELWDEFKLLWSHLKLRRE